MRLLSAIVALLITVTASLRPGTTPPAAEAATCADFPTQAVAQSYLRDNPTDPDGLDADNDGIACEGNPCPCDLSPVRRPPVDATATPTPAESPRAQPTPEPGPSEPGPATGPEKPPEAKATESAMIDPRTGMRVVVVSPEVYGTVAAAYVMGQDAGAVYRALTGGIRPPATGDAGLATR